MDKNSGVLIGLLAVAGGLFYVGHELSRTRRIREASVRSKDKKRFNKDDDFEKRVLAGFRQAAQLQ